MQFSRGTGVVTVSVVALGLLLAVGGDAYASHALSLAKTADASAVNAGSQIGYTITVKNTGDAAATKLQLTDTLPTNSGTSWSISPARSGCSISGGTLKCAFSNLDNGANTSVHIVSPTTGATCGTVRNTASVTSGILARRRQGQCRSASSAP